MKKGAGVLGAPFLEKPCVDFHGSILLGETIVPLN